MIFLANECVRYLICVFYYIKYFSLGVIALASTCPYTSLVSSWKNIRAKDVIVDVCDTQLKYLMHWRNNFANKVAH